MTLTARWARWTPATGIVSAVLWIIAVFALDVSAGDTNDEIVAFYADSGNRDDAALQWAVIMAAIVFFLWFASATRARVQEASGSGLGGLALGAASATAALWTVAVAAFSAMAFAAGDYEDDGFAVDPDTERILETFGYVTFVGGNVVALVLVGAISALALRTGTLPKWLAWLGFPVAAFLLVSFVFVPFLLLLGWMIVVSLVLLFWKRPVGAPEETPTM